MSTMVNTWITWHYRCLCFLGWVRSCCCRWSWRVSGDYRIKSWEWWTWCDCYSGNCGVCNNWWLVYCIRLKIFYWWFVSFAHLKTLYLPFRVFESAFYFLFLSIPYDNLPFGSVCTGKCQKNSCFFDFSPIAFFDIFSLGPIPDGADAVVQVEDTKVVGDVSTESKRVKILIQTKKGTDIRRVVWFLLYRLYNQSSTWYLWFPVSLTVC